MLRERKTVSRKSDLDLTAEQEHGLLAEQVPEPPRRIQSDALAAAVERHAPFDLRVDLAAKRDEVPDRAERLW